MAVSNTQRHTPPNAASSAMAVPMRRGIDTPNGASPQPDEACRGWVGVCGGFRSADVDRDRLAGPVYEPRGAVGWPEGPRPTGARDDATAHGGRCPYRSCRLRGGVHRSDVPERVRAAVAVRGRAGGACAPSARAAGRLHG